ncbi:MAG: hypothetical protein A2X49_03435 [Lentisphaerae bacterium GWF2_52_8]|nr:MAG: hypothetical protein A2X49_03435 [Lentisphaerae bacterium GWF2_52_8]
MYFMAAHWGVYGISLSNLFYFLGISVISLLILKKHCPNIPYMSVLPFVGILSIPCLLMALGIFATQQYLGGSPVLVRFLASSIFSAVLFVLSCWILKIEELSYIGRRIPFAGRFC